MTMMGQAWITLVQLFAIVALVLIALGLMLGMIKPADFLKHVGAILCIVITLLLILNALMDLWWTIRLRQGIVLGMLAIAIWQLREARRQKRGNGRR